MGFALKLTYFIILAVAGLWTARRIAEVIFPCEIAARLLAAGVVFFSQVVVIGAVLGFTGNIGIAQYIAAYCLIAGIVTIAFKGVSSHNGSTIRFSLDLLKPFPVGFFLS